MCQINLEWLLNLTPKLGPFYFKVLKKQKQNPKTQSQESHNMYFIFLATENMFQQMGLEIYI